MTDTLFPDLPGPAPEEPDTRTAGQRLRDRQAARIMRGHHPLSDLLYLHPDAPRVLENDRGGDENYRCGTCAFRGVIGGHARGYPKCFFGYQRTPYETPDGLRYRITQPRVTYSETSDVRAWWPACTDWQPEGGAE